MIEILLQTDLPVPFVLVFDRPVGFVIVVEQPHRFGEAAQGHKQLDALVPRHRAILVIMQNQQRCLDLVGPEDRGVLEIAHRVFPERSADAALGALVLEHPADAGAPADAPVSADHIAHRRARFRRLEDMGAGDQVGDLIAAPAMPLHPDIGFIDKSAVDQVGDAGNHRIISTFPGIADLIRNIRFKDHVAPAGVERGADYRAVRPGRGVFIDFV